MEHSRLAGAIAVGGGNGAVSRAPLAFHSFVRGVVEHDRGYGELDNDPIGGVAEERWLEIQRRGLAARDPDPIVDVVVALHIRRLVGGKGSERRMVAAREFDVIVAERLETAGVARVDAEA